MSLHDNAPLVDMDAETKEKVDALSKRLIDMLVEFEKEHGLLPRTVTIDLDEDFTFNTEITLLAVMEPDDE